MSEPTELAGVGQQAMPTVQMTPAMAMLFNRDMAARAWKAASLYASSDLVPSQFRNRPENVFIMMQLSVRTGQDLFMMLQNCYIVHGRPGFEAKYLIGQLNSSGKIKGMIKYEFTGTKGTDDYGCVAWVIEKETEERIDGPKVDFRLVKAEGWDKDKGGQNGKPVQRSKWSTMPDLMFRYRAAAFLIRTTFPDVMMGLQTREELEDSIIDMPPEQRQFEKNDAISSMLGGAASPPSDKQVEPPFNPPTQEEVEKVERGEPVNDPFNEFDAAQWVLDFCGAVPSIVRVKSRREHEDRLSAMGDKLTPEHMEECIRAMKAAGWTI